MAFDGNRLIEQMLAGGSVYPGNEWYFSLGTQAGNPWSSTGFEAPGPRTLYTGGWYLDPQYSTDLDTQGMLNDTQFECTVTTVSTLRYVFLWQGLTNTKWAVINQLYNYPITLAVGDSIRFPPGGFAFTVYS
jgi:hypothetical protein